jgi:hypothetical protein
MHYLARNLAGQLKEKVEKENLLEFGKVFKLNKVCMGIMVNGEVVTLEEFISGEFIKYINNTCDKCEENNIKGLDILYKMMIAAIYLQSSESFIGMQGYG